MHVNDAVLAVVEGGGGRSARRQEGNTAVTLARGRAQRDDYRGRYRYSLLVGDGLVAAVAHSDLELEAHEGDGGALGRTFTAHRLAALPAVVLRRHSGTSTSVTAELEKETAAATLGCEDLDQDQLVPDYVLNKELKAAVWRKTGDQTCRRPIFLLSHICLKFQKNGCSHF